MKHSKSGSKTRSANIRTKKKQGLQTSATVKSSYKKAFDINRAIAIERLYPEYQLKLALWIAFDDTPFLEEWYNNFYDNGEREFLGFGDKPDNFNFTKEDIQNILDKWNTELTLSDFPLPIQKLSKAVHKHLYGDMVTLYRGIDISGVDKKGQNPLEPLVPISTELPDKYTITDNMANEKIREIYHGTRGQSPNAVSSWTDNIFVAREFAKPYIIKADIPIDNIIVSYRNSGVLNNASQQEFLVNPNVDFTNSSIIKEKVKKRAVSMFGASDLYDRYTP